MAELTEAEILAKGKLVSGGAQPSASADAGAPKDITEADLLANGKLVQSAGPAGAAQANAPANRGVLNDLVNPDVWTRQLGLTSRMAMSGVGNALDIGGAPIAYVLNKARNALTAPTMSELVTGRNENYFKSPSDAMNILADRIGLPKPETPAERIVNSGGSQLVSAAVPLGVANQVAKTGTGVVQKVAGLLADSPLAQLGGSFLGGTAGQTATEMGANPAVATGINLAANIFGTGGIARAENAAAKNYTPAGQKAMALNDAAKKEGVTLSAGDLGSRGAQVFENFTQDLPGTGRDAFMRNQAGQTKTMLERLGIQTQGATEPGEQMIGALRQTYKDNKLTARGLYDDVTNSLAVVPGTESVNVPTFAARAKAFLDEYPKYLESPSVPESVKTTLKAAKDGTLAAVPYQNGRDIATLIGTEARNASKRGETISGSLDQLYAGIKSDFGDWATNLTNTNPAAAQAYGKADAYFKTNVLPFRADNKVRNIVSSKATQDELDLAADSIMGNLLKSGKPNRAEYGMKLSGPEGVEASQRALVDRALGAGLSDRTNAGVSPMRFVNTLNLEDPMVSSVMSRPSALSGNIQNVNDIAQATRRSVGAFETPRTGVQDKALAALVGLVNPATTLQTAGGLLGGQLGNYALRTDPIKGLLFANPANPYTYAFPTLNSLSNGSGNR
jgi:hypothetical protein